MTAKEFVLQRHPELTAKKHYAESIHRGKETVHWLIEYKAKHTYELFASAKTEVKAWNAAKKKIQGKESITTTRI